MVSRVSCLRVFVDAGSDLLQKFLWHVMPANSEAGLFGFYMVAEMIDLEFFYIRPADKFR